MQKFRDPLQKLCEEYPIERLYVFGSVVENALHKESDVDLIIKFMPLAPEIAGEYYWEILEKLETLFGRKVDLLLDRPYENPYFAQSILKTKTLIYERENPKIFV